MILEALTAAASPPLRRWMQRRQRVIRRVIAASGVVAIAPAAPPPRPRAPARELSPAATNEQIARRWIARTAALQAALQGATSPRGLRLPEGYEIEEHRYGRAVSLAVYGPTESDLPTWLGQPSHQFFWSGEIATTPAAAWRSLVERVAILARFDTPARVLAERRKGTIREAWTLALRLER